MKNNNSLLTINNLVKHFDISGGLLDQISLEKRRIVRRRTTVKAPNDVSLSIMPQETIGIVGESGCGKSVTSLSILGLIPSPPGEIHSGTIKFDGQNLLNFDAERLALITGIVDDGVDVLHRFLG